MARPFKGEALCVATKLSGEICGRRAYYWCGGPRCGTHSKPGAREDLVVNPDADELKRTQRAAHVEECDREAAPGRGKVVCAKKPMFGGVGYLRGFVNVFPNRKDRDPSEGPGFPELSPMVIGPVFHGQPGLPPALSIENFHQGNKVYESEIGPSGAPLPEFFASRAQMYQDPTPHRHKPNVTGRAVYSIWETPAGPARVSYIESRQFYCNFYERAATGDPGEPGIPPAWAAARAALGLLRNRFDAGYSIRICGPDGHANEAGLTPMELYLNPSAPFGHEFVIAVLICNRDPETYPWRIHKTFDF